MKPKVWNRAYACAIKAWQAHAHLVNFRLGTRPLEGCATNQPRKVPPLPVSGGF